MNLISTIQSVEEVELEHLREDLRDRRWARHRQQVIVVGLLVASCVQIPPANLAWEAVRGLI
jgi:hypothetical protein